MPLRLAQHLVSRGLLTAQAVEDAQRRGAAHGGGIDTLVLELDVLPESALLLALGEVSGLRPVNLGDFEPNPEVSRYIPANVCERLLSVPLSVDGATLHLACAYPPPLRELEEVSVLLGKRLELWIAVEARVRDWISSIYGLPLAPRFEALLARLDPSRSPPEPVIPLELAKKPSAKAVEVHEPNLEDVLARAVADEPILLEVRKQKLAVAAAEQSAPKVAAPVVAADPRPPVAVPRPPTRQEFPSLVVFPEPGGSKEERGPPPPARPRQLPTLEAPGWTLEQARAALERPNLDRDEIIDVALKFAQRTFDLAAAFAVVRGAAAGWLAEGTGAEDFRRSPPSIPLDAPSLFRTVAMTRGSYVGPVPQDANTASYLALFGRKPRTVFLFPVEVNERLVCLLYGDPGARPLSQRRLTEVVLLCQELPAAFGRLIVSRKRRFGATSKAALSFDEVAPSAEVEVSWSPSAPADPERHRRASSHAAPLLDPGPRPPADFTPLLRRLLGPDATLRTSAVAELARTPEASAKVLAQRFPGPTAWSRLPVAELPEPEELGPIPAALARLGRPGAHALAPLLDADDANVRYFALLTAGSLPYPEMVSGVLRGLFDLEPDIASAARAAAGALRRLPRFATSMRDLRQELASTDTLRRSLAARALGILHDRDSVEGLINLSGSDDQLCAEAAAEALNEITHARIGAEQRAWTRWWAENRGRTRGEWLVQALRHPELDVRLSAIEELSRPLNDNLGYFADAPTGAREAAIRRWETALQSEPRLRRLE